MSTSSSAPLGNSSRVHPREIAPGEPGMAAARSTVKVLAGRELGHGLPAAGAVRCVIERLPAVATNPSPQRCAVLDVLLRFAPARQLLTCLFKLLFKVGNAATLGAYHLLGQLEPRRHEQQPLSQGVGDAALADPCAQQSKGVADE